MPTRTSIVLDDESRRAARQLALRYGCSTSEVIRRALIRQRDIVFGVSAGRREKRRQILRRLFDLFGDSDAAEEVRRLKLQDRVF